MGWQCCENPPHLTPKRPRRLLEPILVCLKCGEALESFWEGCYLLLGGRELRGKSAACMRDPPLDPQRPTTLWEVTKTTLDN